MHHADTRAMLTALALIVLSLSLVLVVLEVVKPLPLLFIAVNKVFLEYK